MIVGALQTYRRISAALLLAAALGSRVHAQSGAPSTVETSVVKVFSTVRKPDLYRPWAKQSPSEVTGSGVVIEGRRILTNAHVVLYASQVQVQANQDGNKISANVEAIAPAMDLAVLKLEDESFFDTHPALVRANTLPEIKDAVMAYGYPTGGTSLSITKGIVSRIEFTSYGSFVSGLRIQVDAAINPGNSGGAAVVGDQMVGLTFANIGGAENIGYIIPNEEIELFLADIADRRYDGKPGFFDELQTFENDALRAFLKLDKTVSGIIVHEPDSPAAAYPLKKWDLITKIGDTPVDNEGMIRVGPSLRLRFAYRIQTLAKAGKVPLTIVRAGKEMAVEVPVSTERPMLIPDLYGAYPSYFAYGPLVFTNATMQFVSGLRGSGNNVAGRSSFVTSALVKRVLDRPAFEGESLVVVSSPFFPHKLSKGYGNPIARVVKTVNGTAIKNLRHLVEVLRDVKADFIAVEFDGRNDEGLVFPRADMLAATEEILTDNGVRSQGSADMMAVWNTKPSR